MSQQLQQGQYELIPKGWSTVHAWGFLLLVIFLAYYILHNHKVGFPISWPIFISCNNLFLVSKCLHLIIIMYQDLKLIMKRMCLADGVKLTVLIKCIQMIQVAVLLSDNLVPSFSLRSAQSGWNVTLTLFPVAAWTENVLYYILRVGRYEWDRVVLTNESVELRILISTFPLFKITLCAWGSFANPIQSTSSF